MVCGGGRDLLCRTETSVGERQPGAGGQRSHASLWDLVFETTSSVSAGTHAWESRKGLLGTDVWIIAAVNRDFPCTSALALFPSLKGGGSLQHSGGR